MKRTQNTKRNRRLLLGIGCMLTVFLLTGTAFAAAGQVSFNQVAIRLFGQTVTEAGESFRASNGQEVPSVITYTDAAGGKTNYISLRQISELVDMKVAWNAEKNSVDIATIATGNGNPDAVVQVSGGSANDLEVTPAEGVEVEVEKEATKYPNKPEYGVTRGAFQEIDPAMVDTSGNPSRIMLRNVRVQADRTGFPTMMYNLPPSGGKYIVYEVKNNGTAEQIVAVARQTTIAAYTQEPFTQVSLAPGATLTRTFSISEDSSRLERNLLFDITPVDLGGAGTDVTISLMQYN